MITAIEVFQFQLAQYWKLHSIITINIDLGERDSIQAKEVQMLAILCETVQKGAFHAFRLLYIQGGQEGCVLEEELQGTVRHLGTAIKNDAAVVVGVVKKG